MAGTSQSIPRMLNDRAAHLLGHQLWRARSNHGAERARVSSGFAELNARSNGGWPRGELSELLADKIGCGRLAVLMPALAELSQSGLGVAFVGSPLALYAPALAQAGLALDGTVIVTPDNALSVQWAAEELLRSPAFGAVVVWLKQPVAERDLRRLKLAVEQSGQLGLLMRPSAAQHQASPAALRLEVSTQANGHTRIGVLKARGINPSAPFVLPGVRPGLIQRALHKSI